jgi:hypothetical protein
MAHPAGRRAAAAAAGASLVTDVTAQAAIPSYGRQLHTDPSNA